MKKIAKYNLCVVFVLVVIMLSTSSVFATVSQNVTSEKRKVIDEPGATIGEFKKDPAKSPEIKWSTKISAKYDVYCDKLTAFAQHRGIIW